MSNKQQTAVEFLEKQYYDNDYNIFQEDFEQAKAMHKEEMINFTDNYVDNCVIPNENMAIPTIKDVPQYYIETYE